MFIPFVELVLFTESLFSSWWSITSWQMDGETMETVRDFIFLGSKITTGGDCSHEIKRRLFLGRKAMTNLDSILKSRDITLPTKVHLVKAMVFPVVMYGCQSWTIKKVECWRTDAFELWCWRRLLQVPWIARRSNQSILKEINSDYSLEGLMLKLNLQYLGHLMWRADSLEKTLMLAKIEGRMRRQDDRGWMVWWYHQLHGHEFERAPGDGEGHGSLAWCSLWGCRESDTTEWLNNNNFFSKWLTQTMGKLCQHEDSLTTLFILIERRSWKKPIGHDASTWQNLGGTESYVYEVLATWRLLSYNARWKIILHTL